VRFLCDFQGTSLCRSQIINLGFNQANAIKLKAFSTSLPPACLPGCQHSDCLPGQSRSNRIQLSGYQMLSRSELKKS